MNIPYN
jgi:hypothetical protein